MSTTTELATRKAAPTVRGIRITWPCTGCGEPVRSGTGYLQVDERAAGARARAHRLVDALRPSSGAAVDIRAHREADERHPVACWQPWHAACDPDRNGAHYWVAIERVGDLRRVLDWTAHLVPKAWLEGTDWLDLLQRLAAVDA